MAKTKKVIQKPKKQKHKQKPRGSQDWQIKLLRFLLNSKAVITASQIADKREGIGIPYPIAHRSIQLLRKLDAIIVYEESKGPKRIHYGPTAFGIVFACLVEAGYYKRVKNTTDEQRISKLEFMRDFEKFVSIWSKQEKFRDSFSKIAVDGMALYIPSQGNFGLGGVTVSEDFIKAMKRWTEYLILAHDRFLERQNELFENPWWINFIGGIMLKEENPDYVDATLKKIYPYIQPLQDEFATLKNVKERLENITKSENQ